MQLAMSKAAETELRDALVALAAPGKRAIASVGTPGRTADTMATRFDEAYTAWVGALPDLPATEVLEALQRVDARLAELADPDRLALWTDAELCVNPEWEALRSLASAALARLEGPPRLDS